MFSAHPQRVFRAGLREDARAGIAKDRHHDRMNNSRPNNLVGD
jgi:hypothetical protein